MKNKPPSQNGLGLFFNVATFDIETSALEAVGAGWLLCAVIKPLGGKPQVFRYDVMGCAIGNEQRLIKRIVDELGKYTILAGHNVERFDWNYIRTRAAIFGIPIPYRPILYDTLKAFRRAGYLSRPNGFGKPTASLAFVADLLGIKQEKTALYPREHWKTSWGNKAIRKEAMDELVDHCLHDVSMNEQVFEKLFVVDTNVMLRRVK